jgi:hypothetical protein
MRTIQLTHEQITLIHQALGIAEKQFADIHKKIIETSINVRPYDMAFLHSGPANFYHEMSTKFADLNNSVENGVLDV